MHWLGADKCHTEGIAQKRLAAASLAAGDDIIHVRCQSRWKSCAADLKMILVYHSSSEARLRWNTCEQVRGACKAYFEALIVVRRICRASRLNVSHFQLPIR
jgi:hypothetical protein